MSVNDDTSASNVVQPPLLGTVVTSALVGPSIGAKGLLTCSAPSSLVSPETCSLSVGFNSPTPTFPVSSMIIRSAPAVSKRILSSSALSST